MSKKLQYEVGISSFGGEASGGLCTCESKKMAILIAETLDKHCVFEGTELLTDLPINWQIRVIEFDEGSHLELVWEGAKR